MRYSVYRYHNEALYVGVETAGYTDGICLCAVVSLICHLLKCDLHTCW